MRLSIGALVTDCQKSVADWIKDALSGPQIHMMLSMWQKVRTNSLNRDHTILLVTIHSSFLNMYVCIGLKKKLVQLAKQKD